MSIAAVITRGYGTFGSIGAVILRGYLSGATPPPVAGDTHDPYLRKASEKYLKNLKKQQKLLAKRHDEKFEQSLKLRKQIDEARGIYAPEEGEASPLKETENEVTGTIYVDRLAELLKGMELLESQLHSLAIQKAIADRQYRLAKDEEDMRVILEFLNAPLRAFQ